jgi:Anti-sigma-K factor rskA
VTRPPDFDELMEGVESQEERDRLRRVHDLLVTTAPPPELSAALASPQTPPAEEDTSDEWLPRRRVWAGLLAGAGALVAAFGIGYLAGNDSTEPPAASPETPPTRVISLRPPDQNNTAGASIHLGRKGADGNWPMVVTVRGLGHLTRGDYYTLALTKKGKPIVTCGTFNVSGQGATTIRMIAAYDLKNYDGWAITKYDAQSHADRVLMTEAA